MPVRWIEMVRHTLKSLGPKVLADRMVRDYVLRLYTPAGAQLAHPQRRLRRRAAARGLEATGARSLAGGGASTTSSPAASATRPSSARPSRCGRSCRSGDLSPDDVDVQVVHGRVRHEDDLVDTTVASLAHAETYEAGRHRFEGRVALATTGPFGYTVRVLPQQRAPRLAARSSAGSRCPSS